MEPRDIQRWSPRWTEISGALAIPEMIGLPAGQFVRYTDHERVVRALQERLEERADWIRRLERNVQLLEDRIQDDHWAALGDDL